MRTTVFRNLFQHLVTIGTVLGMLYYFTTSFVLGHEIEKQVKDIAYTKEQGSNLEKTVVEMRLDMKDNFKTINDDIKTLLRR